MSTRMSIELRFGGYKSTSTSILRRAVPVIRTGALGVLDYAADGHSSEWGVG